VHRPARGVLSRAGVSEHVLVADTIDDALRRPRDEITPSG
jgi:hypothetical protein